MTMILIHWDFTTGRELSYIEGLKAIEKGETFVTCCLDFFCFDYLEMNPVVIRRDGKYIDAQKLLLPGNENFRKELRKVHNIRKMLVAGSFEWSPKEPA